MADPGRLSWDLHLPLLTVAPGQASGILHPQVESGPDATSRAIVVRGLSGQLGDGTAIPLPPYWWELSGAVGVMRGLELRGFVGWFRLGGEARVGILDQRNSRPLSLALSVGAAFLPFFGRNSPWFRAGVDVSRRLPHLVLMANLYASAGREGHRLELSSPPDGFTDELDAGTPHDGEALPYLQVVRRETRLALALGAGFHTDEGRSILFIVGLVPYVVLGAGSLKDSYCAACSRFSATGFEEDWGISVTLGVASSR